MGCISVLSNIDVFYKTTNPRQGSHNLDLVFPACQWPEPSQEAATNNLVLKNHPCFNKIKHLVDYYLNKSFILLIEIE